MTSRRHHHGSLLYDLDLDKLELLELIARARQLRTDKLHGKELPRLGGHNLVLLVEKASTRTRCAFEVAAHDQGARVTCLGPERLRVGRDESVADTARVLGRWYDGIAYHGTRHSTVEQLDEHAGVPVWNASTDRWHPTQSLADVLTMTDHRSGPVEDIAFCYTGDGGTNVARSLLVTGALLGMDVRIASPSGLRPPVDVVTVAERAARSSGARILVTDDVHAAVRGADFVYTDAWVGIDDPEDVWAERVPQLLPYRVTEALMGATGRAGARFMHCLPATHDRETTLGVRLHERFGIECAEVTEEVFESKHSVVFEQAENRMHTVKALLRHALTN